MLAMLRIGRFTIRHLDTPRGRQIKLMAHACTMGGYEATVRMIQETSGEALFCKADVSQAAEVQPLVHTAVETYGRLDCAFNNAGVEGICGVTPAPMADLTEDMWDHILNINLKGVWLCTKYEIPQMPSQGGELLWTPTLLWAWSASRPEPPMWRASMAW
jgi:NAD(P)-dependent dehydrogenase (short-subunit alcohol dehydrogenase family)